MVIAKSHSFFGVSSGDPAFVLLVVVLFGEKKIVVFFLFV